MSSLIWAIRKGIKCSLSCRLYHRSTIMQSTDDNPLHHSFRTGKIDLDAVLEAIYSNNVTLCADLLLGIGIGRICAPASSFSYLHASDQVRRALLQGKRRTVIRTINPERNSILIGQIEVTSICSTTTPQEGQIVNKLLPSSQVIHQPTPSVSSQSSSRTTSSSRYAAVFLSHLATIATVDKGCYFSAAARKTTNTFRNVVYLTIYMHAISFFLVSRD